MWRSFLTDFKISRSMHQKSNVPTKLLYDSDRHNRHQTPSLLDNLQTKKYESSIFNSQENLSNEIQKQTDSEEKVIVKIKYHIHNSYFSIIKL